MDESGPFVLTMGPEIEPLVPKKTPSSPFALLGKKLGMTQIFDTAGNVIPVTVVQAGPCVVTQKKTKETDGYDAVQLGFDDRKTNRVLKPEAGHAAKAKTPAKRYTREVRLDTTEIAKYELGQVINATAFQVGDKIDVQGISIGKGFQGVMKRHNFRGARHSHNHEFFRHGGSIGMRSTPGKVFKNKKMPGQMGNVVVTTQNLEVVAVEADKNWVLIRGAVPGHKNAYVYMKGTTKGGFKARDLGGKPAAAAAAEAPAAE